MQLSGLPTSASNQQRLLLRSPPGGADGRCLQKAGVTVDSRFKQHFLSFSLPAFRVAVIDQKPYFTNVICPQQDLRPAQSHSTKHLQSPEPRSGPVARATVGHGVAGAPWLQRRKSNCRENGSSTARILPCAQSACPPRTCSACRLRLGTAVGNGL